MNKQTIHVTYNEIHQIVADSSKTLADFFPDLIVAIGCGGFLPARILRTFLKIPVISVVINRYNDTTGPIKNIEKIQKIQWFDENAEKMVLGKRVLIVDEVDDTRKTLNHVVSEIGKLNPSQIGVYVIHNKIKDKENLCNGVEYFAGRLVPDVWIKYPWDAIDIEKHSSVVLEEES